MNPSFCRRGKNNLPCTDGDNCTHYHDVCKNMRCRGSCIYSHPRKSPQHKNQLCFHGMDCNISGCNKTMNDHRHPRMYIKIMCTRGEDCEYLKDGN